MMIAVMNAVSGMTSLPYDGNSPSLIRLRRVGNGEPYSGLLDESMTVKEEEPLHSVGSASPPSCLVFNSQPAPLQTLRSASLPSLAMFPSNTQDLGAAMLTHEGVAKVPISRATTPHYYSKTPRCRRVSSELTRSFVCSEKDCERRYEAWRSLQHHLKVKHGIIRKKYDSDPSEDTHSEVRRPQHSTAVKPEPRANAHQGTSSPQAIALNPLADVLSPLLDKKIHSSQPQPVSPHVAYGGVAQSKLQCGFVKQALVPQQFINVNPFGAGALYSASVPSLPAALYGNLGQIVPPPLTYDPLMDDFDWSMNL